MLRHSADGRVCNLNRASDGLKIWIGCWQMKFMNQYVSNYMKLNFIHPEKSSRQEQTVLLIPRVRWAPVSRALLDFAIPIRLLRFGFLDI